MTGKITGMYYCPCGEETPCELDDLNIGRVFQCPWCRLVCGHVTPQNGGRAWVRISDDDVALYGLLKHDICDL